MKLLERAVKLYHPELFGKVNVKDMGSRKVLVSVQGNDLTITEDQIKTAIHSMGTSVLASSVHDWTGITIFPDVEVRGVLVFVDYAVHANWEHPCKYVFFPEEGNPLDAESTRPPADDVPHIAIEWI